MTQLALRLSGASTAFPSAMPKREAGFFPATACALSPMACMRRHGPIPALHASIKPTFRTGPTNQKSSHVQTNFPMIRSGIRIKRPSAIC